jgi:hypothetical protein
MKSLINEHVEHIKFGEGLIICEEHGKITVEFPSQTGKKLFQYPDAFERYLKFDDSSLQAESLLILQDKKNQEEEENERRRLEYERKELERKKEELLQKKLSKKTSKTTKIKKASV